MSTQQILPKSKENYYQKISEITRCSANNYYMYSHFRIGENINYLEVMYYNELKRILCEDNCELIDWIKKKLEGRLEDCGIKSKKRGQLIDVLNQAQKHTKCNNQTDAVCECLPNWAGTVEW